ncbi:hypothetical protein SVI_0045 [Shewanella violacea DSS12]|uniref:Uncharacterized protein n=1 Tax=Shewanella violacea (strain JCM 10179 / CIP 106290 / LMG 19151 / DSS12) TaxID=637905 RepID=D4ZD94_SHEVD|nr:hypothetical protein SVI_0045 [Shewanella violacea DSS12]
MTGLALFIELALLCYSYCFYASSFIITASLTPALKPKSYNSCKKSS